MSLRRTLLVLGLVCAPSVAFAAEGPTTWDQRFADAGHKLVAGDPAGASADFAALAADAPSDTSRAVALEQLRIASEAARKKGLVPSPELGAPPPPMLPGLVDEPSGPRRRTGDELFTLALTMPAYGIATGFWLDSLIGRKGASIGVPILSLGVTGFAGIALGMLEISGSLRYSVPQSISTGIVIGASGGIAVGLYSVIDQNSSSAAYRSFTTWTWGLATAGGVTGGVLASTLKTTPGRSAWVGTTTLVTAMIAGGVAGAVADRQGSNEFRYFTLTSAVSGVVGLGAGFATTALLSPSISRVRYIDLAWFSGGAIALGTCVATAKCSTNAAFSALSVGTAIGFLAGFFGTWGMGQEAMPADGVVKKPAALTVLERAMPYVSPENGGMSLGLGGTL